jgi:signal transduction histidine kinase
VVAKALSYEEIEHELKTPLASVRSLSEILRDYPDLSDEERRRFLDVILRESERLGRAVERLLGSPAPREGALPTC